MYQLWERQPREVAERCGPQPQCLAPIPDVRESLQDTGPQGHAQNCISTLTAGRDMGLDGDGSSANKWICRDAAGYTLGYFAGDYHAIGGSQPYIAAETGTTFGNGSYDLYNGNIRNMVTAIGKLMPATAPEPLGRTFKYDQINRISSVQAYNNIDLTNDKWQTSTSSYSFYSEHFTYDGNGNIEKVIRNGDTTWSGSSAMDSLDYFYYSGTNRLKQITDKVNSAWYKEDLDNQTSTTNYGYDAIGNMTSDVKEEIASITWTVYGKVQDVVRTTGSTKPDLHFEYDASGHRVMKIVKTGATPDKWKFLYYVRDAQGNEMATYEYKIKKLSDTSYQDSFAISQFQMYGSSRLGSVNVHRNLRVRQYQGHLTEALDAVIVDALHHNYTAPAPESSFSRTLGNKQYELNNHLGNVLATISDRRIQHSTDGINVTYNEADVVTAQDYYAFGAPMPRRKYQRLDSSIAQKDSCVSCAILKQKIKAYVAAHDTTWLLKETQLASYLNTQLGTTQTAATYLTALRTCKLLREGLNFANTDSGGHTVIDMGSHNQYKTEKRAFTLEAWVNIDNNTILATIFNDLKYSNGKSTGISLHLKSGKPWLIVGDGANPSDEFSGDILANSALTEHVWHHIVAMRKGDPTATDTSNNNVNNWKIYVDGVSVSYTVFRHNFVTGDASGLGITNMFIGYDPAYPSHDAYLWKMRDLRMYNRALSTSEIAYSYNSGCGNAPKDTNKLDIWLPLNEGKGTTAYDHSGYGVAGDIFFTNFSVQPQWFRELDTACMKDTIAFCGKLDYMAVAGNSYRFGFNGKEKDNETYGEGDEYDFGARIYDARVGRFMSVDPLTMRYSDLTPFQFSSNSPIMAIDLDGREALSANYYHFSNASGYICVLNSLDPAKPFSVTAQNYLNLMALGNSMNLNLNGSSYGEYDKSQWSAQAGYFVKVGEWHAQASLVNNQLNSNSNIVRYGNSRTSFTAYTSNASAELSEGTTIDKEFANVQNDINERRSKFIGKSTKSNIDENHDIPIGTMPNFRNIGLGTKKLSVNIKGESIKTSTQYVVKKIDIDGNTKDAKFLNKLADKLRASGYKVDVNTSDTYSPIKSGTKSGYTLTVNADIIYTEKVKTTTTVKQ